MYGELKHDYDYRTLLQTINHYEKEFISITWHRSKSVRCSISSPIVAVTANYFNLFLVLETTSTIFCSKALKEVMGIPYKYPNCAMHAVHEIQVSAC